MNIDKLQNEAPQQPKASPMKIAGYNLLIMLGYGILSVIPGDESGLMLYALMVVIHFLFCLYAAIYYKNWMWVLSGLLIIIVGLSICSASGNLLLSKRFEG